MRKNGKTPVETKGDQHQQTRAQKAVEKSWQKTLRRQATRKEGDKEARIFLVWGSRDCVKKGQKRGKKTTQKKTASVQTLRWSP